MDYRNTVGKKQFKNLWIHFSIIKFPLCYAIQDELCVLRNYERSFTDWWNITQQDARLLSLPCPPSLSLYISGVATSYYSYITTWLIVLSCCDQISLDGSETMNDDITIWAPATCRSKNQLVFGQNERLNRECTVVWWDFFELTGYWDTTAGKVFFEKGVFPYIFLHFSLE